MDKEFTTKFIKASVSASVGMSSSILFHFLSIMLMTRFVPKDELGIYILILVIVHCLAIMGGLGLDLTLVKFISEEPAGQNKGMLSTIVVTRLTVLLLEALIIYSFGYWLVQFFDSTLNDLLIFIIILFFLSSFRDLFYNLLQGLQLFKKYALVQIVSALLRFILILAALYLGRLNLHWLVYIELGAILMTVLVQLICIPFKVIGIFRPSLQTFKNVIKFGFPLYLNNILTFLYDRVNLVIIGFFLSPANIAYFDIAGKIPEGFLRMFRSFIVVYFPNLSALFSKGEKQDAESVMNISLIVFAFVLFLFVLISFLFGKEIIRLVFSERYIEVALAFALLMLIFSFRALSNIMGYSLISAGYSNVPVKVNSVSSVVNIIGALVMIPAYGYMGAVYALLIMNIISLFMHGAYLIKAQIHPPFIEYLRLVCILLLLLGIYFLVGIESVLIRLLMTALYLVISWVFIKDLRKVMRSVFTIGPKIKQQITPA